MTMVSERAAGRSFVVMAATMLVTVSSAVLATWMMLNFEVETIEESKQTFDEMAADKITIIVALRDIIEFEAVSSDLEAFALDMNEEYLASVAATIAEMKAAIAAYRLLGVNDREAAALESINGIVSDYDKAYAEAEWAISGFNGFDAYEADIFDSAPALTALIKLDEARLAMRSLNFDAVNETMSKFIFYIELAMAVLTGIILLLIVVFHRYLKSRSQRTSAMTALYENEKRTSGILKNVSDAIITIDERGVIESFNPAAERIFGYRADEVIGDNVRLIMNDHEQGAHDSYMENYCSTGKGQILGIGAREVTGKRKDGSPVNAELIVNEMISGDQRKFIGVVRDIAKRKQGEEALRESRLRLAQAQRIARIGHWIWDELDQRVIYHSDELARIFGVEGGEFPTNKDEWMSFVHEEDRPALEEAIGAARECKSGYQVEYRILRKDGQMRWLKVVTEAQYEISGRHVRTIGTAQDVTQQKSVEENLRDQTATVELLQKIASAANDATSVGAALKTCLDEICRHLHWPVGHAYIIDESDHAVLVASGIWHLDDANSFTAFQKATTGGRFDKGVGLPGRVWESGRPELVTDIKSDGNFPRNKSTDNLGVNTGLAFPLLVGNNVAAVLEFFTSDVTEIDPKAMDVMANVGAQLGRVIERKKAMEELRAAKEDAEIANRSKSEFLSNMSHELRTPLNAVIGFSEMIANEMFGPVSVPKYLEYAKDIHTSGEHLLGLINDILDLSKIEAGKVELIEETIDINRIVSTCMTFVKERAKTAGVELINELPDSLPELFADERKVKQILLNLLSNAVKFTPSGGTVTARATIDPEAGFILDVVDTGIGIALEDIPKAMAQFGQIDSSLSRKYEGTGLGLPLSEALARLQGGSLNLRSSPNIGTTVSLVLPPERIIGPQPQRRSA